MADEEKNMDKKLRGFPPFLITLDFDLYGVADPFSPEVQRAPEGHKPQDYLPSVKSVIILGLEIIDSILQTTPSGLYSKHYDTVNVLLDTKAYQLVKWLQNKGFKSIYFTETTSYPILWEQYNSGAEVFTPAFNHMVAAIASGLGKKGHSGVVLTLQYGPRQRFITILTEAPLPYGKPLDNELCFEKLEPGSCRKCITNCPVNAIRLTKGTDVRKCWIHWTGLRDKGRACGVCIKVCPLGG